MSQPNSNQKAFKTPSSEIWSWLTSNSSRTKALSLTSSCFKRSGLSSNTTRRRSWLLIRWKICTILVWQTRLRWSISVVIKGTTPPRTTKNSSRTNNSKDSSWCFNSRQPSHSLFRVPNRFLCNIRLGNNKNQLDLLYPSRHSTTDPLRVSRFWRLQARISTSFHSLSTRNRDS